MIIDCPDAFNAQFAVNVILLLILQVNEKSIFISRQNA